MRVENESRYKAGPINKFVELRVTVMLDAIPGWGHNIDDHIELIMRANSYVQSIEYDVEGN